MTPVFVIKEKVCPCLECCRFVQSRYDEADVVDGGLLVYVYCIPAPSLVVTPRGKKFGGNMVVRIACHFSNEGKLSCCNIFFNVGYIEEFCPR